MTKVIPENKSCMKCGEFKANPLPYCSRCYLAIQWKQDRDDEKLVKGVFAPTDELYDLMSAGDERVDWSSIIDQAEVRAKGKSVDSDETSVD